MKELAGEFRHRKTIRAVQLTEEMALEHLIDKKPLPEGMEMTSASCHSGRRTLSSFYARVEARRGEERHEVYGTISDWFLTMPDGTQKFMIDSEFQEEYVRVGPVQVSEWPVDGDGRSVEAGPETLRQIVARCTFQPMGDHGLEGYQAGDDYKAVEMRDEKGKYWRVFPVAGDGYYETCAPQIFRRYFKENRMARVGETA